MLKAINDEAMDAEKYAKPTKEEVEQMAANIGEPSPPPPPPPGVTALEALIPTAVATKPVWPEVMFKRPRDELSIVGDKDEFLTNAAQRLKTARLTRPWERFMETQGNVVSEERQRFPSLRHLENLKNKRRGEEEGERQRNEWREIQMDEFDEAQEEQRNKPLDTEWSIRNAVKEFRNSAAGHDWLDLLDAHQKENRIRNVTGEERQPLTLPEPQFGISGEERMLLESLKGNEQPLQDLRAKKEHEEEFFQPAPPIAVQQPIEQPIEPPGPGKWIRTDEYEGLGSLFG